MESKPPVLLISHRNGNRKHLIYNLLENSSRVLNNVPILHGMDVLAKTMESKPPVLLTSHGNGNRKHLIYNLLENSSRVLNNVPILHGMDVLACSYGWLVLTNPRTNGCCLWNPISMEKIELPKLQLASMYNICVLSKPPTESGCHVLFNSVCTSQQSFCRIGDEEFSHVEKVDEGCNWRRLRAVGSFEGKIYGFVDPGNLFVTISFVGNTLEFNPIMMVDEPWRIPQLTLPLSKPYGNMWLIESPKSCGGKVELLLVQKIYSCKFNTDGLDFRVFQIDIDRMKCVELDYIGERAIFLSYTGGGFCCSSSTTIKSNSIYYTNPYKRSLYVFDLEDMSTALLFPSCIAGYKAMTAWVDHHFFCYDRQ